MSKTKVCLVIADGFGIASETEDNGIYMAKTPVWDKLRETYPNMSIEASGHAVGLPEGIMGNSEVGHLTIGSGRISYQSLELINREVQSNAIDDNAIVPDIVEHLARTGGNLHFMGLVSDGAVHSHQKHLGVPGK